MFDSKKYMKKYYQDNKEIIIERSRKHYRENRDSLIKRAIQKSKDNPERQKKSNRKWRLNNLEWFRQRDRHQTKTNINFNLNKRMRGLINLSLKGNKNGWHWEDLVGYTLEDLIKRLKQTIPKGYAWRDFLDGKFHIDHILPIRLFQFKTSKDEEFKDCWNLYNLRLLTKKQNLSKNCSINNPILLGLLLKEMV